MNESNNFEAIQISLASGDKIRSWSRGEVKKPETINYRTLKPEKDGLFCERIFGPTKDWECHCGKYKRIRFKGVVCDRCGVEVTKAKVRRERMGHIELAAPVSHIWYFKGIPSRMGLILDISPKNLELVLYFSSYIVTDPGDSPYAYKEIMPEDRYREAKKKYGSSFKAAMGAEAVRELLRHIDLDALSGDLKERLKDATGQKKIKIVRRLEVVEALRISGNRPEWMVLDVIPVIPPDLRPMVQLDGGRFATSDLNDLYRRVINRNNRLKRLLELGAPDIIVRNEKRMLQEAVDALIDNGRRGRPVTGPGGRPLKSLSDMLKGKQGRFRQNLLGKRVDYSGRSVIVVGPDLKFYQCGLPKKMALELFKPFIMKRLVENGKAHNIKSAKRMVEKVKPDVWDVLDDVIKEHPVLLNRAPTLHRLGIQAFEPVLVEGKALKLHPLVCTAYNADFDGDQMAIHLPLSVEAQAEARFLMLSVNNILAPKDGSPITTPTQDMILGSYYLTHPGICNIDEKDENGNVVKTKETIDGFNYPYLNYSDWCEMNADRIDFDPEKEFDKRSVRPEGNNRVNEIGDGKIFCDFDEMIMAYDAGIVAIHALVKVRMAPSEEALAAADPEVAEKYRGVPRLVEGTVGRFIFNKNIPQDLGFVNRNEDPYSLEVGFLCDKKHLGKIIDKCYKVHGNTGTAIMLDHIKDMGFHYSTKAAVTIAVSDMKIPEEKPEFLRIANEDVEKYEKYFRRGLVSEKERYEKVIEIWNRATDSIADALMDSLGTLNNLFIMANSGARGSKNQIKQVGGMRGLMANASGKTIEIPITANFREGLSILDYFISSNGARKGLADTALRTADSGYLTRRLVDVSHNVIVRSDDCGTTEGIVAEAFYDGKELIESLKMRIIGRTALNDVIHPETGEIIVPANEEISEELADRIEAAGIKRVMIRSAMTCKSPVGICEKCYGRNLATGETVNIGEAVGITAAQSIGEPGTQLTMRTFHTGGVAGSDITQGLPRVEELFEARKPKGLAEICEETGDVVLIESRKDNKTEVKVRSEDGNEKIYVIPYGANLRVKEGDRIEAGEGISQGPLNPHDILRIKGVEGVYQYLIKEVQRVYKQQGVDINDKHIEVIVSQMLSKHRITDPGDTNLLPGALYSMNDINEANAAAVENGGEEALCEDVLLGITKASLATDSFLSAASFQETTRVLTDAAIKGKKDHLRGLKENVIIGKLIPAGTGMKLYKNINLDYGEYAPLMEEAERRRLAAEENKRNVDRNSRRDLMSEASDAEKADMMGDDEFDDDITYITDEEGGDTAAVYEDFTGADEPEILDGPEYLDEDDEFGDDEDIDFPGDLN